MKKHILTVLTIVSFSFASFADEGMWLPILLGQKNYNQMTQMGLKLTQEQLYDINNASMKDAVIWFGGGCTGEVISNEGLILTNHHCGYDAIATLSTPDNNRLANGFWALDKSQELPAQGLSVAFLVRMEDVTERMLAELAKYPADSQLFYAQKEGEKIAKAAREGGKYESFVRDMFKGNQYYMFVMERYTDIRLVGTPPESIGKFGGDTDNWMWPRHTGDFSIFRIYANKDNKSATYDASNVPFKPKKYLPVSLKGVENGDFAMIFGFPGRTNRYETSMGVKLAIEQTNPAIVKLRTKRLQLMKEQMDANVEVRLQLASRYAQIANYWKYFIGQTEQLKHNKVYDRKFAEEETFKNWASANPLYSSIFSNLEKEYDIYKMYNKHQVYLGEGIRGSILVAYASAFLDLEKELLKDQPDTSKTHAQVLILKARYASFYKALYNKESDQEIMRATLEMYYNDIDKAQHPEMLTKLMAKTKKEKEIEVINKAIEKIVSKTMITDSIKLNKFLDKPNLKAIQRDLAIQYAFAFVKNYNNNYKKYIDAFNFANTNFGNKYLKGLMEMQPNKYFYPDANSTMRCTYGKIKDYSPKDAVHFSHFTTLKGIMEKEDPASDEFTVPTKLKELYKNKDYGQYAGKDGEVPVGFLTTNDITGGNSGSPVINANGELIGTAFDGNWEAMSGDIAFDAQFKRTICVDVRYTLFIIDKLGGATNLIKEMTLVK